MNAIEWSPEACISFLSLAHVLEIAVALSETEEETDTEVTDDDCETVRPSNEVER